MLLLDAALETGSEVAFARVVIDERNPFFQPGRGVPSWLLIELYAQTAALIGNKPDARRQTPPGYLLGTRRFACDVEWLAPGIELDLQVKKDYMDAQGMGTFDCRVIRPAIEAPCKLVVYLPQTSTEQEQADG